MSNEQILDPIDVLQEELKPYRHNIPIGEVDEITLLSIEEAQQLPKDILAIKKWWWLRSLNDYQDNAAFVDSKGYVNKLGNFVDNSFSGVRPAFRINNLKLSFGEKVYIGGTLCTVISEGVLLSDDIVCRYRFDNKSHIWRTLCYIEELFI